MKNRSVMRHDFASVPATKVPRSVFNLDFGWKGTFDSDFLVPFFWDEVLPGSSYNLRANILMRMLSPTIKPIMDNLWVTTIFFSSPNRILWSNWKKFMGEQVNPADSISFTVPYVSMPNVAGSGLPIGHLYDYFGIPVGPLSGGGGTTGLQVNNFIGRCYNQFWNAWVRDENLQNSVTEDLGDGPDNFSNYNLLKRGRRFDYFGAALPWAQKGGVAVSLPLGTSANVLTSASDLITGVQNSMKVRSASAGGLPGVAKSLNMASTGDTQWNDGAVGANPVSFYPTNLYADLTTATSAPLNSLRQSITLQQFLEMDARGGTRWPELLLNHFGTTLPDAQWRPELLSITTERLSITPVAQTAPKGAAGTTTDQGNLAGFGTYSTQGYQGFTKTFLEHSTVIGVICVTADLTYQQGLDYKLSRRTRYDYPWPVFAHLGERAIRNKELYANLPDGTSTVQKDGILGYVPQYEEERFRKSLITGNYRSYLGNGVNPNTLDIYHLSQAYATQPTLGPTWITSSTPISRIVAVPALDDFGCDVFFQYKGAVPLPVNGVPGLFRL